MEACPEVFTADQVLGTLIAKVACHGVVVMLLENHLLYVALIWHVEQTAIVKQAVATMQPVLAVEFNLFLGNQLVVSWL